MRGHWLGGLALVLSCALGGCLLPPPDTPPIPPSVMGPGNSAARPAAPTVAQPNAGAATAGSADAASGQGPTATLAPSASPAPTPSPARVSGTLEGAGAIAFTPESADPAAAVGPIAANASGAFAATLAPGVYRVSVTVGRTVYDLDTPLTVRAGETRALTIKVSGQPPVATVSEPVPLSTPSPSPSPKAAPSAAP